MPLAQGRPAGSIFRLPGTGTPATLLLAASTPAHGSHHEKPERPVEARLTLTPTVLPRLVVSGFAPARQKRQGTPTW